MAQDATRVLDAYREAWNVRQVTGRTDVELLFEVLEGRSGMEPWTENPVAREMLATRWDAGVSPRRLRLSLLRELPTLIHSATVAPVIAVYRVLRDPRLF